jgi:hypothetical protein
MCSSGAPVTSAPGDVGWFDRAEESAALGKLLGDVRSGRSRTLILRGDMGIGKTRLLGYAAGRARAAGIRVERAAGAEPEMELAFAGLHQLMIGMLDRAGKLPDPQRTALEVAFGQLSGDANPDIAAQLFISPRTVEYHLRKVYTKLGIASRTRLARQFGQQDLPGTKLRLGFTAHSLRPQERAGR